MLAQVGRVRHQRRHSDVSLANAVPEHLTPRRTGRKTPDPPSQAPTKQPAGDIALPPQLSARVTLGERLVLWVPGHCLWTG